MSRGYVGGCGGLAGGAGGSISLLGHQFSLGVQYAQPPPDASSSQPGLEMKHHGESRSQATPLSTGQPSCTTAQAGTSAHDQESWQRHGFVPPPRTFGVGDVQYAHPPPAASSSQPGFEMKHHGESRSQATPSYSGHPFCGTAQADTSAHDQVSWQMQGLAPVPGTLVATLGVQ